MVLEIAQRLGRGDSGRFVDGFNSGLATPIDTLDGMLLTKNALHELAHFDSLPEEFGHSELVGLGSYSSAVLP